MSFRWESGGCVSKCQLISQANCAVSIKKGSLGMASVTSLISGKENLLIKELSILTNTINQL